MIKVIVNYQVNEVKALSVHSDANSKVDDQDLVGAGVSAIMNGAFNAFGRLTPNDVDLIIGENLLKIEIKTSTQKNQRLMEMVKIQLGTIADQYPKNIQIEERY